MSYIYSIEGKREIERARNEKRWREKREREREMRMTREKR